MCFYFLRGENGPIVEVAIIDGLDPCLRCWTEHAGMKKSQGLPLEGDGECCVGTGAWFWLDFS
jgi:hypothetical protein